MHIHSIEALNGPIFNLDTIVEPMLLKLLWNDRLYGQKIRNNPACYEIPFKNICDQHTAFENLYRRYPNGMFIVSEMIDGETLGSIYLNENKEIN